VSFFQPPNIESLVLTGTPRNVSILKLHLSWTDNHQDVCYSSRLSLPIEKYAVFSTNIWYFNPILHFGLSALL